MRARLAANAGRGLGVIGVELIAGIVAGLVAALGSFKTNSLSPGLKPAQATGEAYTPTAIGPDGAVCAINNAKLYCCVSGTATGMNERGGEPRTDLSRAMPIVPAGRSVPVAPTRFITAALLGTGLLLAAGVAGLRLLAARRLAPLYVRVKGGSC